MMCVAGAVALRQPQKQKKNKGLSQVGKTYGGSLLIKSQVSYRLLKQRTIEEKNTCRDCFISPLKK